MVPKSDKQIILKVVCVAAAFFLWLYINIMEMPVKTVQIKNIPVYIENTEALSDQKLTVLNQDSYKVNLTLKGNVGDLQTVKKDQFRLVVDISSYALRKGVIRMPVEVKSSPGNVSIEKSEDLWVNVAIDNVIEKNFDVSAQFEGSAKNYIFDFKPIITPGQVTVKGAETYVNKVASVAAKCNVDNADQDINLSVPLEALDGSGKVVDNVSISPSSVDVFIPVNKTKTVGINVKTSGSTASNINIKSMIPEQYSVVIAGRPDALALIDSMDTEPIDLSKITGDSELNVKLVIPQGITIVGTGSTIKVKVTTDKVIQKSFTVQLQFKNLGSGLEGVSETQQVVVILSGYESIINGINAKDITCYVDLTGYKEGEYTLPVAVTAPPNTTMVSASPSNVKITLKAKS